MATLFGSLLSFVVVEDALDSCSDLGFGFSVAGLRLGRKLLRLLLMLLVLVLLLLVAYVATTC